MRTAQGFVEAGGPLGVDSDEDGRAVAPIDVDGDGRLDLVVLSLQSLRLLLNRVPSEPRFARVRLVATRGERHALGAVVKVTAGGRSQVDRVRLTAGFHTQHSTELHFGLRKAARIEALEVRWPSGAVQRFTDLPTDRRLTFTEGSATAQVDEIPRWSEAARPAARFELPEKLPRVGGAREALRRPGVPTVVNFWGPSCAPCAREMPELNALARARGEALRVVGVSVERDPERILEFAKTHAVDFPLYVGDAASVTAFFGTQRKIPLPTTFVLDGQGRVLRAFKHEIDRAQLEAVLDQAQRPVAPDDYWELALRLARGTGKARAKTLMAEAVAAHPKHLLTLRRHAELLAELGDAAPALAAIEAARALAPNDPDTLADHGQLLSMVGRHAEAEVAVAQALRLDPRNVRALTNAGVLSSMRGDTPQATRLLKAALEIDPYYEAARSALKRLQSPPR